MKGNNKLLASVSVLAFYLGGCQHFIGPSEEFKKKQTAIKDATVKDYNTVSNALKKKGEVIKTNDDKQKYMDIAERCAEKAGEINNVDETAKFRRRYVFDTSDKFDTVDGKLTSSDMHHKCRNMRDAISRLATSGCYRTYLSVYLWQGAEDFEYASAPYANQTPLTLNGDNALQWKPVDCKYVPKSNGPLPAPLQRGTKDIKSFCPSYKAEMTRWETRVDKSTIPARSYRYMQLSCFKKV